MFKPSWVVHSVYSTICETDSLLADSSPDDLDKFSELINNFLTCKMYDIYIYIYAPIVLNPDYTL